MDTLNNLNNFEYAIVCMIYCTLSVLATHLVLKAVLKRLIAVDAEYEQIEEEIICE